MEENEDLDPVQERGIDLSEGLTLLKLPDCSYVAINPELVPGGMPSERFHCFYGSNELGSCTFYIRMNDDLKWEGEQLPPFISQELIDQIGNAIERRNT